MNITGLQFFGREDPAVDEFFDPNDNHFNINAPLLANERSLRVKIPTRQSVFFLLEILFITGICSAHL